MTEGVECLYVETHNWGKAAKFFQALGYNLEFTTEDGSGLLRNGDSPAVFLIEVPESQAPRMQLVMKLNDADAFRADPPVEAVTPFEDTHWGTKEMSIRDPDGRNWILRASAEG